MTDTEYEHLFGWMRKSPTWSREIAAVDQMRAEVERLLVIEKAAQAWESAKSGHIDEDTAFDYAYVARAILAGYGPEGKERA